MDSFCSEKCEEVPVIQTMEQDRFISDPDPIPAVLKFQQDGGGFVEIKESGTLTVTSRQSNNVTFKRQRICPVYGDREVIIFTLQSSVYPTKYLTGYISDNSISGNPILLPSSQKPTSASHWRSRSYTECFGPEEDGEGRGWILLQYWGNGDTSNPQLFFTISYNSSNHLEFQLTDINNSRKFVKEHGAFTLDSLEI